jgi:VWFA-related protein
MRRVLQYFLTSALLLCTGWPLKPQQPPPPDQNFTISTDVNLVLLDVSVKDPQGGFVSNLPKEAFTIMEDGKPQTISQFASNDLPVTVGIIVDNSGSMRPKKPDVITSALVFAQASNPLDEIFVINFNDKVWFGLPETEPFTDDIAKIKQALVRTDPSGKTALNDAIIAGIQHLEDGKRDKKTLIVISDGGDNASTHKFNEVTRRVLESRATIYTIGIFNNEDADRNPDVLKKLANTSGGYAYFPQTLEEVVPICRQIAKDIRTRYTIGYIPTNAHQGGVRHVKVAVNPEGRGKLTARTRTSYIMPTVRQESADRSK